MTNTEPTSGHPVPNKKFNPFRPINTMEEALDAQRSAAGIGVLIALGYAVLFGFQFLAPDRNPLGDSAPYTTVNAIALVIALVMAGWAWLRRSLIATVLLSLWFLLERVTTALLAPQTLNFVSIAILLTGLSCAILSVRGHMAAGRIRKTRQPDAKVFE